MTSVLTPFANAARSSAQSRATLMPSSELSRVAKRGRFCWASSELTRRRNGSGPKEIGTASGSRRSSVCEGATASSTLVGKEAGLSARRLRRRSEGAARGWRAAPGPIGFAADGTCSRRIQTTCNACDPDDATCTAGFHRSSPASRSIVIENDAAAAANRSRPLIPRRILPQPEAPRSRCRPPYRAARSS